MIFTATKLEGACLVDIDPREDERGFFARIWCQQAFEKQGLVARIVQTNLSYNKVKGTLRGMHYQRPPHAETKLVRAVRGGIYDVIVDLRPDSATYKRWIGVELTAANRRALFVPEGFAHGFQSLEDDTEVIYQVSAFYAPGAEGGARYNDPAFDIRWPLPVNVISDKDANWPDYQD